MNRASIAAALAACGLVLSAACPANIKWNEIVAGTSSGIKDRGGKVAATQKEWQALWAQHTSNVTPAPALPKVNLAKETVVAVFAGNKPTGGYTIKVASVDVGKGNKVTVTVSETKPPAGAMAAEMITQPFQFIRLSGGNRKVTFAGF